MEKINLMDIKNEVKELLEKNKIFPKRFGVSIVLDSVDFDELARDHPNRIMRDLIIFSDIDEEGIQTFVQINRLVEIETKDN
jgi:hypothetical protein